MEKINLADLVNREIMDGMDTHFLISLIEDADNWNDEGMDEAIEELLKRTGLKIEDFRSDVECPYEKAFDAACDVYYKPQHPEQEQESKPEVSSDTKLTVTLPKEWWDFICTALYEVNQNPNSTLDAGWKNQVILGQIETQLDKQKEKTSMEEMIIDKLAKFGWTLKPEDIRNAEVSGNIICFITNADNTAWQVDTNTGLTRHKGLEQGCFWTEWE